MADKTFQTSMRSAAAVLLNGDLALFPPQPVSPHLHTVTRNSSTPASSSSPLLRTHWPSAAVDMAKGMSTVYGTNASSH